MEVVKNYKKSGFAVLTADELFEINGGRDIIVEGDGNQVNTDGSHDNSNNAGNNGNNSGNGNGYGNSSSKRG
ncbi:MAG: hypothetical protein HUJ68_10145 [Clostridia bacterium]|nr:hypothetical protein [Clostridia bacterium]